MNGLPPSKPLAGALQSLIAQANDYAKKEPAKALAAGLAAGLIVNLLPRRLFSGVARMTAPLVRPALLGLGVVKACELCSREPRPQTR